MRWDAIQDPLFDLLEADAAYTAVIPFAATYYMPGERGEGGAKDFEVPSCEVHLIADNHELEVFEFHLLQVDLFTRSLTDLATAERRVRANWHAERERTLGGVWMTTQFVGARPMPGAGAGVWGRQLDFEIRPIRESHVA